MIKFKELVVDEEIVQGKSYEVCASCGETLDENGKHLSSEYRYLDKTTVADSRLRLVKVGRVEDD